VPRRCQLVQSAASML